MSNTPTAPLATDVNAAIAILDRDGVIIDINEAWRQSARDNGYRGDTFGVGEHYLRHYTSTVAQGDALETSRVVSAGLTSVLEGEQSHFMLDCSCHAPEQKRWFRIVVTPRSFAQRDGAIVAHIPVTREKELEIALRDSQRRLNEIYHIADIGDFEYQAAEDRSFLSPPVLRMWRRPESEVGTHQQFFDSIHPDDRERVAQQFSEPTWKTLSLNYRFTRPDGEVRHVATTISREVDQNGGVLRYFGLHHDVTSRQRAEERLNGLFDASVEVLTIISFKGYFKRVNPAFVQLLGYSAEELMSRPCIDFVHLEDRERTMKHVMAQIYENNRDKIENRYIRKDGSIALLSWSMSASGKDILGVARDVTAERAVALALQKAKDAAEAASLA